MNCASCFVRFGRHVFLVAVLLTFLCTLSRPAAAQNCGGQDQRACCIGEASFGTCQSGFAAVLGCDSSSINCACGNLPGLNATQTCRLITSCGGDGQRACCNGLSEFSNNNTACNSGLTQASGCTGNCWCGGTGPSVGAQSLGTCVQITPCGGEGQRACCDALGEFSNNGLACNSGLVQVTGCDESTGNCYCSSGLAKSLGTCVQPTHCGGKGERACCVGTLEYSNNNTTCDSGLIAVNGCAGDCTCGGTTSIGEAATQTCTVIEKISEPAINGTPSAGLPAGPECPAAPALCGYADLHVHMFAHLAHGGAVLAGAPYDPVGGINTALGEDYGTPNVLVNHKGDVLSKVDGTAGLPQCPDYMLNSPLGNLCQGQYLFHGDHTPFDTTTYGGTNDASASNFGAPSFNGWPQWTTTIHQQVYYKWLERAWRGGLRVMVMSAVTNETLCKTTPHLQKYDGTNPTDCSNSMIEIDTQINAAKAFQSWLDTQSGGPGMGWFQIVTTPQQATSVIQQGKLAVILGIEIDNLFNCHFGADTGSANEPTIFPFEPTTNPPATITTCTPDFIRQQVKHYYDMGVRHIFPIHNFDNAYGGPAAWQDSINVGNVIGEGEYYSTENCRSSNYGFWLDKGAEGFEVTVLNLLGYGLANPPDYPSGSAGDYATCNQRGLTDLGQTLINSLMDYGIIIDIDHMSRHAIDATLAIAENRHYAGIATSHVQFFDMYTRTYSDNFGRHERMRTSDQLMRIKNLGGIISVMTKDDVQDTGKGYCLPNAICFGGALAGQPGGKFTQTYNGPNNNYGLNNNCRYSTTEWAQLYMYGADKMGGPVTLGSDFNGVAGHVGPRFGSAACGGDGVERSAQEKVGQRLVYPFTIPGFGTFDKQVSGQRTFDFNTSGLAHIGLLPDMIADLKNVGLTDAQLIPLFSGSQAYISTWSAATPVIVATKLAIQAPSTAISGSSFQITVTAEDDSGNTATTYPGTVHFTSSDGKAVLPSDSALSGGVGTFTVTLNTTGNQTITATDTAKASITGTSSNITVDQPPLITSTNTATFTVGMSGSFTVTATGFPTPTFSETGVLPAGVSFTAGGVLNGTPAARTGGTYPITITASNGISPNATQNFTLVVDEAPAITSANTTTFTTGTAGSFTVTATGYPAPVFSETGALPSGVTLSPSGVLSGTPAAGTGGTYHITVIASNGVSPDATQSFTLQVQDFTMSASPGSETIPSGHDGVFTISTASLGGLTGNVALTCSGGPPNSACTVMSLVTLGNAGTATIELDPRMNVNHGTFTITFTGTLGSLTHTTQVSLTVK